MNKLLLLPAILLGLTSSIWAKGADDDAIAAAAKSYMAANSSITKFTAVVDQVEGDFARVKVTPEVKGAEDSDATWVFVKKNEGKWSGIAWGPAFTNKDYQQLGIPNSLRIP